jgi:hypothetical protein
MPSIITSGQAGSSGDGAGGSIGGGGGAGATGTGGGGAGATGTGGGGAIGSGGRGGTGGSFGTSGRGGTTGSGGRGGNSSMGGSGGAAGRGGTTGTAGSGAPDGGSNPDGAAAPTFTDVYTSILVVYCGGSSCHNPGTQGGVGFASQSSAYTAVKARVTPGNGTGSRFYMTVNSGSMPRGQAKLSAANLAKIKAWIDAGALNN